jgi:hypothetical protein
MDAFARGPIITSRPSFRTGRDPLRWLDVFSADNRPHLLEIAQLSWTSAEWRLQWFEAVVAEFGNDVMTRE